LASDHDRRHILLVDQIEQELHLIVSGQRVTRLGRQHGGLFRLPGTKGLALLHTAC
jgi:hypothetical protein